jgi:hypothetical protein
MEKNPVSKDFPFSCPSHIIDKNECFEVLCIRERNGIKFFVCRSENHNECLSYIEANLQMFIEQDIAVMYI